MAISKNAKNLLRQRYCREGEQPKDVYKRVAEALSLGDKKFEKKLKCAMTEGYFLPNSPCLRNAGTKKGMLHACLTGDTILLDNDKLRKIEDIHGDNWYSWSNGEKEIIELKCNNGLSIKCTPDHKIMLDNDNFIEAKDTLNKDIKWGLGNRDCKVYSELEVLRGFLFGDGSKENTTWVKVNIDKNKEEEIADFLNFSKFENNRKNKKDYCKKRIELEKLGCNTDFLEHTLPNRDLPDDILYGNSEKVASFLMGLFEANGSVNNKGEINLKTTCKSMIYKVQILLASFGIPSYITVGKAKIHHWYNGDYLSKEKYDLFIRVTNSHIFKEKIGFYSSKKNKLIRKSEYSFDCKLKVIEIKELENCEVFDFTMKETPHWNFANGFIAHNCFVLPVEDSMESISKALHDMIIIFKNGGGVGMNFSKLRPRDAQLGTGGTSSGVVSFMKLFDTATEVVKQGGFRRGALMGVLNFEHAEVIEFIRSKLAHNLTNFNISIMVSDSFMKKVEKGEEIELKNPQDNSTWGVINAKTIFDVICFCAWNSGDPGFLFYDRINKDNKLFPKVKIKSTNPCGEVPLPSYGACCLGSINISKLVRYNKFDFKLFEKHLEIAVRALRNNNAVCVTDDAEALTKEGWKKYNELSKGEEILTYSLHTDKSEWQPILKINEFDLENENMIELSSKSGLDLLVTPNHKVIFSPYNLRQRVSVNPFSYRIATAKHLPQQCQIPACRPINREKDFNIDDNIIKLIGWVITEGHKNKNAYVISQSRGIHPQYSKELDDIFKDLGLKIANPKKDSWYLPVSFSKELKLEENHKIIPLWIFNSFSLRQLKLLFDTMIKGDGSTKDYWNYTYAAKDLKALNRFQFLTTLIGYRNTLIKPTISQVGVIRINKRKYRHIRKKEIKNFKGKVWCPTVENGFWIVRRNGKVCITGNSHYPLPEITRTMKELDPIGVGVMGFADCLIKLGIKYDSQESLDFIDEIGKVYKEVTDKLAKDCFWKRIIAPTGSLSLLADCSSGIEPVFDVDFERHLTVGVIRETRELYKSKFVRTAHDITPEWHLKIQAQWQKWLDGSISKTVNMPNEASVDDVKEVYMTAWKLGVKGVTIFRDGSKGGVLKRKPTKRNKCDGDECHL
jgi:hypothetical protein